MGFDCVWAQEVVLHKVEVAPSGQPFEVREFEDDVDGDDKTQVSMNHTFPIHHHAASNNKEQGKHVSGKS